MFPTSGDETHQAAALLAYSAQTAEQHVELVAPLVTRRSSIRREVIFHFVFCFTVLRRICITPLHQSRLVLLAETERNTFNIPLRCVHVVCVFVRTLNLA